MVSTDLIHMIIISYSADELSDLSLTFPGVQICFSLVNLVLF